MGTRKYTILFALLTFVAITAGEDTNAQNAETRLPVMRPERNENDRSSDNGMDLLATLKELYSTLVGQIAILETRLKSSPTEKEKGETYFLVQHYTAQKINVEREIELIESIGTSPKSAAVPRHILINNGPEEKIVPSLINIFKKPKPTNDMATTGFAYSAPYPPYYYPGYGPQYPYPYPYPYPYQGIPPAKPDYNHMDSLIQSTFPGYETDPNNNQQMTFERNSVPQNATNFEFQPQFPAPPQPPQPPQVPLQGELTPQIMHQPSEAQSASNPMISQSGQGVFIYYPNAVITEDDDQDRPSIVDRVGQAFDRFGQAITNLATRQTVRTNSNINVENINQPTKIKVVHNRPRSSPAQETSLGRTLDDRKPKYRWVGV